MRVFITGFYGTGSSAYIDMLAEHANVTIAKSRRYEHNIFCCHDGLLDLEQRLFGKFSDQMIRDVAINQFIKEMKKQNDNDFGWYGSYKKQFGNAFWDIVTEFISAVTAEGGQDLFSHTTRVRFSPAKALVQLGARILTKYRTSKYGRKYVHDGEKTRYLAVGYPEFLAAANVFCNRYLALFEKGMPVTVYDHMLLPEQCSAMEEHFKDCMLIIVDRDPRDIYFSANYVWNNVSNGKKRAPFPYGIDGFCDNWKRIHRDVKEYAQRLDNVKLVSFEDLVYRYDETAKNICAMLGIEPVFADKGKYFDPAVSIKNTQVFDKDPSFAEEREIIERELADYLYDFPYTTDTPLKEARDI